MTFQEEITYHVDEPGYLIFRRKKITVANLLALLLLRRSLVHCDFVECSEDIKQKFAHFRPSWTIIFVLTLQKVISCLFSHLWHKFGCFLEFIFNLFSINGGFSGLLLNFLKGSIIKPKRGSVKYRSINAYLDQRIDLYKIPSSSFNDHHLCDEPIRSVIKPLDLYMMASKIAYENRNYIQNVVIEHWKMHFAGFFNCCKGTQAFILCDKAVDASVIVVAFRGTELFSSTDWLTDFDLSWISIGKNMGKVYTGFFMALGMKDDKDFQKGWPKNCKQMKLRPIAYYAIRNTLNSLLDRHKNAQIVLTGHSLGGALASVFPSILIHHEEKEILGRMRGIVTFGQPRVGDKAFADYMDEKLQEICGGNCFRVVYRYDLVPRTPFDDPIFQFKHFGRLLYYSNWYNGEVMKNREANKNYNNPKQLVAVYANAFVDLIRGIVAGRTQLGVDFRESRLSLCLRLVGLLLPGVASHSPRDYVNAARLGKIKYIVHPIAEDEAFPSFIPDKIRVK